MKTSSINLDAMTNALQDQQARHVVMTTNNAYDAVLLVDDGLVISAWTATPEVIATYLSDGGDPSSWDAAQFAGFDGTCEAVEDYGTECGRDGQITDASRREFWAR